MGFWLRLQQFFALRKLSIIRIFQLVEISLILFLIVVTTIILNEPKLYPYWLSNGILFGKTTSILLTVTLIPGVLGRFRIVLPIRSIMVMFRRHLGILTYLAAVSHLTIMYIVPTFLYGFFPLRLFQVYGLLALLAATPLFLTSNDFAVRTLGKWWKRIHKLVFLMLFFAALHTITIRISWTSVMLISVLGIELLSFLVQYIYARRTPR